MSTTTHSSASRKWPSLLFWPPPRNLDYLTLAFAAGLAVLAPPMWWLGHYMQRTSGSRALPSFSALLVAGLLLSIPIVVGTLLGLRLWSLRAVDTQRLWPRHLQTIHRDLGLSSLLVVGLGLAAAALDPAMHPVDGVCLSLISASFAILGSKIPPLLVFHLFVPLYMATAQGFLRSEPWVLVGMTLAAMMSVSMILPIKGRMPWRHHLGKRVRTPGGERAENASPNLAFEPAAPSPRHGLEIRPETAGRRRWLRFGGMGHQMAWLELTGGSRRWYRNLVLGFMIPMASWLVVFSILLPDAPWESNSATQWIQRLLDAVLAGGPAYFGSATDSFFNASLLALQTWFALHYLHQPTRRGATDGSRSGFGRVVGILDPCVRPLTFFLLAAPFLSLAALWLTGGPDAIDGDSGEALARPLFFVLIFLSCVALIRRSNQPPLATTLTYPVDRSQRIRGVFTAALRWQAMVALAGFATMFLVGRVGLLILAHQGLDISRWQPWIPAWPSATLGLLFLPLLAALQFFNADPENPWPTESIAPSTITQATLLVPQACLLVFGSLATLSALGGLEHPEPWTPLAVVCLLAAFGASQFCLWLQLAARYAASPSRRLPRPGSPPSLSRYTGYAAPRR